MDFINGLVIGISTALTVMNIAGYLRFKRDMAAMKADFKRRLDNYIAERDQKP